jgi:hypothetical protein
MGERIGEGENEPSGLGSPGGGTMRKVGVIMDTVIAILAVLMLLAASIGTSAIGGFLFGR